MRFRKRPVEIEAQQVTITNGGEIAGWCSGSAIIDPISGATRGVLIQTLEGTMRADVGDWVICGVGGEFYPCKPGIFVETYERVQ